MAIGLPAALPLLRALEKKADSAVLRESAHHIFEESKKKYRRLFEPLEQVRLALEGPEPPVEVPLKAREAIKQLFPKEFDFDKED